MIEQLHKVMSQRIKYRKEGHDSAKTILHITHPIVGDAMALSLRPRYAR